ncbi:glycosyltransferase family 2 protein [bacterium]|nr:glycosyltransferase family 2 protein [bacterium]
MKPVISIIIPTLGNLENLKKIMNSVLGQNLNGDLVEILVVVNGLQAQISKVAIQDWFAESANNVKLLFIDQKGVNIARNAGLKNANSDILIFFDDDCVVENKNFLQKHLQFHQSHRDVFAYGGGYSLTTQTAFWDRMYNYLQMKWLYTGVSTESGDNLNTKVLLGGNFSIKSVIARDLNLSFDESIVYGGSEYEFFKKAAIKKLPMVLNTLNVYHHTSENLWSVTRKLYKQGRGKAHIDQKYGLNDVVSNSYKHEAMPFFQKLAMLYFNYIFWAGYYTFKGESYKLFTHMLKDLVGNFHKTRYELLKKISHQISSKKNQGDRF